MKAVKSVQLPRLHLQALPSCLFPGSESPPVTLSNGSSLPVSVRVMENEEGRKEYLVFPPSKSQCPASSQKGRKIPLKGNGRRIDYALYSDEGLPQDWKLVRCTSSPQETFAGKPCVVTVLCTVYIWIRKTGKPNQFH